VRGGTVQQAASRSRRASQFPTFGLPALHEGASLVAGAFVERRLGASLGSISSWIGAARRRGGRESAGERPGAMEGNCWVAAADGLIAAGFPMSDARAAGLMELGFLISEGAALGFAPIG
jgi:hypothetical protein